MLSKKIDRERIVKSQIIYSKIWLILKTIIPVSFALYDTISNILYILYEA